MMRFLFRIIELLWDIFLAALFFELGHQMIRAICAARRRRPAAAVS